MRSGWRRNATHVVSAAASADLGVDHPVAMDAEEIAEGMRLSGHEDGRGGQGDKY
ncbi:MAG: hypothetical protein KKH33_09835 [Alphaproteobacteria bacterium]|nr:hypothetical protein [Alphaproteobacteria bacterium]